MNEEYIRKLFEQTGLDDSYYDSFKKDISTNQEYNKKVFQSVGLDDSYYDSFKKDTGLVSSETQQQPTQDVKKKDLSDSTSQKETTELGSGIVSSSELEQQQNIDSSVSSLPEIPQEIQERKKIRDVISKLNVSNEEIKSLKEQSQQRIEAYKNTNKDDRFFEGENVGSGLKSNLLQAVDYLSFTELFGGGQTLTREEEFEEVERAYEQARKEAVKQGVKEDDINYDETLDKLAEQQLTIEKISNTKSSKAQELFEDMDEGLQEKTFDFVGKEYIKNNKELKRDISSSKLIEDEFLEDKKKYTDNVKEHKLLSQRLTQIQEDVKSMPQEDVSDKDKQRISTQYQNVVRRLKELEEELPKQQSDLLEDRESLLSVKENIQKKYSEKLSLEDNIDLMKRNYDEFDNVFSDLKVGFGRLAQSVDGLALTAIDAQNLILSALPENSDIRVAGEAITDVMENKASKALREKQSYEEDFKELYAKPFKLSDVKDVSDVAYLGAKSFANNAVSLSMALTTGGVAPYLLATTASGEKRADIEKQKEQDPLFNPTPLESLSATAIAGASEFVFSKIGTVHNVKQAKNVVKGAGNKFLDAKAYSGQISKDFISGVGRESLEELGVGFVDATTNYLLLDNEKAFKEFKDSSAQIVFDAGVIGGGTRLAPHALGLTTRVYGSAETRFKMNKNLKKIKELSKALENRNLSDNQRKLINEDLVGFIKDNQKAMENELLGLNKISSLSKKRVADIYFKVRKLRKETDEIKNDKTIDDDTKKTLIGKRKAKAKELLEEKESILSEVKTDTKADEDTKTNEDDTQPVETKETKKEDTTTEEESQDKDLQENDATEETESKEEKTPKENIRKTEIKSGKSNYEVRFNDNAKILNIKNKETGEDVPKYSEFVRKSGKTRGKKIVKKNPFYSKLESKITGDLTRNQIKKEKDKKLNDAINEISETDVYGLALSYIAEGNKVSDASNEVVGKESDKEFNWVTRKDAPSIERASEIIYDNLEFQGDIDQTKIRDALISVISSNSNVDSVKDNIIDNYSVENTDINEQQMFEFMNSMSEEKMKKFEDLKVEDDYISELNNLEALIYFEDKIQEYEAKEKFYESGETLTESNDKKRKTETKTIKQKPIADATKDFEELKPTPDKKINITKDKQDVFDGFDSGLKGTKAKDLKGKSFAYQFGNRLGRLAKSKDKKARKELKAEINNFIKENFDGTLNKADLKRITSKISESELNNTGFIKDVFDIITEANNKNKLSNLIAKLNKKLKTRTTEKKNSRRKAVNVDYITEQYINTIKDVINGLYTNKGAFTKNSIGAIKKLNDDFNDVMSKISSLNTQLDEGKITKDVFDKRIKKLLSEKDKIEGKIEDINIERSGFDKDIEKLEKKHETLMKKYVDTGNKQDLDKAVATKFAISDLKGILDANTNELSDRVDNISLRIEQGKNVLKGEVRKEAVVIGDIVDNAVKATNTNLSGMTTLERQAYDESRSKGVLAMFKFLRQTVVNKAIKLYRKYDADQWRDILKLIDKETNVYESGYLHNKLYKDETYGAMTAGNNYRKDVSKARAKFLQKFREIVFGGKGKGIEKLNKFINLGDTKDIIKGFLNLDSKLINTEHKTGIYIINPKTGEYHKNPITGEKIMLNKSFGEIMHLYLMSKSPENRQKLIYTGFTEESFKQLDKYINANPKIKEFADWMMNDLKERLPEFQEAHKDIYRTYFDTFDNYWISKVDTSNVKQEEDVDSNNNGLLGSQSQSTKKRTKNTLPEDLNTNAVAVYFEYIDSMYKDKNYGRFKKAVNALLNTPTFRANLRTQGGDGSDWLFKSFRDSARRVMGIRTYTGGGFSSVESGVSATTLLLNFYSALKQPTTLVNYLSNNPNSGFKSDIKSTAQLAKQLTLGLGGFRSVKRAWDKSPTFRDRMLEMVFPDENVSLFVKERKITKSLASKYSYKQFTKLMVSAGLFQTKVTDAWTVANVWEINYEAQKDKLRKEGYKDKKFIEKRAIQEADPFIRLEQSPANEDISLSEETGSFMSFTNRYMNQPKTNTASYVGSLFNMHDRYKRNVNKYKGNTLKAFRETFKDKETYRDLRRMLVRTHLTMFAFSFLSSSILFGDDEKEEQWEYIMLNTILAPFAGVTFIGNLVTATAYLYPKYKSGTRSFSSKDFTPAPPAIQILTKDIDNVVKIANNEGIISDSSIFEYINLITKFGLALPIKDIEERYFAFKAMREDGVTQERILRFLKAPRDIWQSANDMTEMEILERYAKLVEDDNVRYKASELKKLREVQQFNFEKSKVTLKRRLDEFIKNNPDRYNYFDIIEKGDVKLYNKLADDLNKMANDVVNESPMSIEDEIKVKKFLANELKKKSLKPISKLLNSKRTNQEKIDFLIGELGMPNEENQEKWMTLINNDVLSKSLINSLNKKYIIIKNLDEIKKDQEKYGID